MNQRTLFIIAGSLATLLLQVAAILLGPMGIIASIFTPFPAAYVFMRQGMSAGGGVVVLVMAVLAVAGDSAQATLYFLQFGLGSFVLPFLLRLGQPWDRAVAGTLVTMTAAAGLALFILSIHHQTSIAGVVDGFIQGEVERFLAVYQQSGPAQDQLHEVRAMAENVGRFLASAYPGIAIAVTGGLLLITTALLAKWAAGKYQIPGVPFSSWKAPEKLIWGLILAGFGVFFADGSLQRLALNLATVLLPIYFLQGMAVVTHFFVKKGISTGFRVAGYILVAIFNPLPLIITSIGVFDLWADFRKPRVKKT
jgi:uncharacterized protein YybS (DUF2232 family)